MNTIAPGQLRARYPQYSAMNLGELPVIALRIARIAAGATSRQRSAAGASKAPRPPVCDY